MYIYVLVCSFTPELVHAGATAKNERYGGLNPNISRVISTHGTYDPWHALGLTHDVNCNAPVIIITGKYIILLISFAIFFNCIKFSKHHILN